MVGMDLVLSLTTQIVGSVADRDVVHTTIRDLAVDAIIHAGALHKPNIETSARSDFVSINVRQLDLSASRAGS